MSGSGLARAAGSALLSLITLTLLNGCAKRYRVQGLVLAVDPAARTVTVSHREIPGYMPAMAMPFRAAPGERLDRIRSGSRVQFEWTGSLARQIRILETNTIDGVMLEAPPDALPIGAVMTDFALVDEQGRSTRLSDFAGKLVALNFIYTRCPLPEVCPRLSASFAALQRRFSGEIPARLVLLSVTLDPIYDTPEVLARYAGSLRARSDGWRFLTGDKQAIDQVSGHFGLIHWPEEGLIVHTSMTGLIGPDRRLLAVVEGSSFRLEQLADLVRHHLEGK
jgi:protein SCO1/2